MPKNSTGTPQSRSRRRSTVRFASPESSPTRRKGGSKRSSRFSNSSARKGHAKDSDAQSDYFDPHEETFVASSPELEDKGDASEDDDDEAFWEDEKSMLDDLFGESPEDMSEHRRADQALSKLQPAFNAESRACKQEFADAFIPLIKQATALVYTLNTKHDKKLSAGIQTFNDACRGIEASHIRVQDDLKQAWAEFETTVTDLANQLQEALDERERIWNDYEQAVDALVDPLVEELQALPGLCENRICALEKEAKKIAKANSASKAEAKVKAMMGRMI